MKSFPEFNRGLEMGEKFHKDMHSSRKTKWLVSNFVTSFFLIRLTYSLDDTRLCLQFPHMVISLEIPLKGGAGWRTDNLPEGKRSTRLLSRLATC